MPENVLETTRQKLRSRLNLSWPAQQFAISNEWHQIYKQSFPGVFPQARKLYQAFYTVPLTVCTQDKERER